MLQAGGAVDSPTRLLSPYPLMAHETITHTAKTKTNLMTTGGPMRTPLSLTLLAPSLSPSQLRMTSALPPIDMRPSPTRRCSPPVSSVSVRSQECWMQTGFPVTILILIPKLHMPSSQAAWVTASLAERPSSGLLPPRPRFLALQQHATTGLSLPL